MSMSKIKDIAKLTSGLPYLEQSTYILTGSFGMDTTKEQKLKSWRRQRNNALMPIMLADMFLKLLKMK